MKLGRFPRPTIRCLQDDLDTKLPPATEPLDRVAHVIVGKAGEVARSAPERAERIVELDDHVFWKIKIERWRGALWSTTDESWIAAVGYRRAGDGDDFYNELGESGRRWKAEYNRTNKPPLTTSTFTDRLLPTELDRKRIVLEDAVRVVDDLRAALRSLTLDAVATDAEARGEAAGCEVGVLIRRTETEIYVAVRIVGQVPKPDVHALVLDSMPAIADRDGWFIDAMPARAGGPGEIVWSNLLDEAALSAMVDERD